MGTELAAGALILAILGAIVAYFKGRMTAGKNAKNAAKVVQAEQNVVVAQRNEASAEAKVQAVEDRQSVEQKIDAMPDVSTDDDLSVNDRLRKDWSRD